jgi:hypothetical protein
MAQDTVTNSTPGATDRRALVILLLVTALVLVSACGPWTAPRARSRTR